MTALAPITPFEAQRRAVAAALSDEARLQSLMHRIARDRGFPGMMERVQAALQHVAAELREEIGEAGWVS